MSTIENAGKSVVKLMMEMLCENWGWQLIELRPNPKKRTQYLADCCDANGEAKYLLYVESGKFYQFISERNWQEISFTPEERKANK